MSVSREPFADPEVEVARLRRRLERLESTALSRIQRLGAGWPWQAPVYENGWTDYGSGWAAGAYRKEAGNVVRVRGLVRSGTAATIFTLPVGYRPAAGLIFTVETSAGPQRMNVRSSGVVDVSGTIQTWHSLVGIAFHADQ